MKEEVYPNYSVYLVEGGMLKKVYTSKRIVINSLEVAIRYAQGISLPLTWEGQELRKRRPVAVVRYTAPYETDIVFAIDRYGKEIK